VKSRVIEITVPAYGMGRSRRTSDVCCRNCRKERDINMPIYITLYKWTEQGIKNVKQAPARIEASIKSAEAAGGKVLGVYLTMGDYDLVAISESPNDETAAASLLGQCMQGNVRSTTLRAFTKEQFAEIVKKLP
jgi:uncharacterized protein with GYD domain